MVLHLGQIVEALGGELIGDPSLGIARISPLESAQADSISFLSHPKYQQQLSLTKAGCVIVAPAFRDLARERGACIVTDQPYLYFARLTRFWRQAMRPVNTLRVHPSAVIDPEAEVHPTARIGALCVIERGARIGADTLL